jgi:hypothetical protein
MKTINLVKMHKVDDCFTAVLLEKDMIQEVNRSLYNDNDFWRYNSSYVFKMDIVSFILAADLLGYSVTVNTKLVTV